MASPVSGEELLSENPENPENPEQKVERGGCSNQAKIALVLVLVSVVAAVLIDQFTASCTLVEQEDDRYYRILCDPVTGPEVANATAHNQTLFLCATAAAPQWRLDPPLDPTQCISAAACVTVGVSDFLLWVEANVVLGLFAFMAIYVVATVCFVPGSILTIGAGATFAAATDNVGTGVALGTLGVWIGANIGCCIAFVLGRHILRNWVAKLTDKYSKLRAVDTAFVVKPFTTVLLLRFSPIVPFNAFNYLMGATRVPFKDYFLGSLIGMLPGTTGYVFIGAAIAQTAKTAAGTGAASCDTAASTVQIILLVVGIVMTIAVVVLISVFAKRELNKITASAENTENLQTAAT